MSSYDGPVELAWLDRRGVITAVNDAWRMFCTANGGDPGSCGPGTSYLDVCDADPSAADVSEVLRAQLAGERAVPAVFTIPCDAPEESRWFNLHLTPRLDPSGALDGVTVAIHPVDAPVGGVAAAAPFTDLIESSPDGALLVDAHGVIHYANRPLQQISGYSREDLTGRPVEMLVADDLRDRHRAWRNDYQAEPRARPMGTGITLALRRADGTSVPVEISLAPVVVGDAPMTFASIRDVSEVRAQDLARRRLLYLLDLDPDAVYVVDAETARIEYANSGATALLGFPHDELLTMTMWDVSPKATVERRKAVMREHEHGGLDHVHLVEIERRAKDGSLIPCDTRSQLVTDPDGHRSLVIVDRDARPRLAAERAREVKLTLSHLVAQVTARELSGAPAHEVYHHLVVGAASLLEAESASLVVYDPAGDRLETLAASGTAAEPAVRERVHLRKDLLLPWMRQSSPVLLPDGPPVAVPDAVRMGPGVVAQFRGGGDRLGLLAVFRGVGRVPFESAEGELLADLAHQLALIVELGRAQASHQRLQIIEERQRIARDLHDMVVQDLIGIGMQLAEPEESEDDATRQDLVAQLDDTIRRLRLVVFDARTTQLQGSVSDEIRRTVREAARTLDHRPTLTIDDGVDALTDDLATHLLSVLREGLSNVARHAGASATEVSVTLVDQVVSVVIEDDGHGLGDATVHGTGTASMRERAEMMSGSLCLTERAGGGARLEWTARVPA